MKKIILIVLTGAVAMLTSCAQKVDEKPVFYLYRSVVFLPKLLVGTAD